MKKLFTILLCAALFAVTANAATYYVDAVNGNDTGKDGLSWANAVKTIAKAETLAASGQPNNIYIKGSFSYSGAWNMTANNYYGSFAGTESSPSQRAMNDNNGNGIIESWEFKYPTTYTSTNNANAINGAASILDGFTITHTGAVNSGTGMTTLSSPVGQTVQNCVFTGSILSYGATTAYTNNNYGCLLKVLGTFQNNLVEKNTVSIVYGATDIKIAPILYVPCPSSVVTVGVSGCIFRNNLATISNPSGTAVTNLRGTILCVDPNDGAATVTFSDCIVHNNEVNYTGAGSYTQADRASIAGGNSYGSAQTTDVFINCLFANNKTTNLLTCMNVFSGSKLVHKAYNNVFWNNQNTITSTSTTSSVSMNSSGTQYTGSIFDNNYLDAANGGTWGTGVWGANNKSDLGKTYNSGTNPPYFKNPPLNAGSNIIGADLTITDANCTAISQADWRIYASSYLVGKGAATSTTNITTDKAGLSFATAPAVGAYEGFLPTVSATTSISSVNTTIAQSGGTITADNGAQGITARGVCWSTSANPTIASSKTTDGTGSGTYSSSLTSLTANTTYYVRAYATNAVGTTYGSQVSFTTRSSRIYYVNTALSSGSNNGSSWDNAFQTWSAATAAGSPGIVTFSRTGSPYVASSGASWTTGSTTITLSVANSYIAVGDAITGTGLASGSTVTAINGATLTLNNATTATVTAGFMADAVADDIYIKGSIPSQSSLWTMGLLDNFYGSCAGNEISANQRPTNDNDGNGIVEPWEFLYPTTYTTTVNGTAINGSSAILDGFTITQIGTVNSGTSMTTLVSPIGQTVQNCVFTGSSLSYGATTAYTNSNGGCLLKVLGTFKNNLIEKNNVSLTYVTTSTSSTDIKVVPYLEVNFPATNNIVVSVSGCIFRNNVATISNSGTAGTTDNLRGMVLTANHPNTAGLTGTSATFSDCIVHNNEISYTGTIMPAKASIASSLVLSSSSSYDNFINCTFANNKMTNMASCFYATSTGNVVHKVYNNVFWNNKNTVTSTSTTSTVSMISQSAQNASSVFNNNYMDTYISSNWGTNIWGAGNKTDLGSTYNNGSNPPYFKNPPLNSGNNIIGANQTTGNADCTAISQSDWRITSVSSYLYQKGIAKATTGIDKDKANVSFATNPTVGAYECITTQGITFSAFPTKTYGDATFMLSATGGASGSAVTFTSSDPTVATCTGTNGSTVTILKAGTCNLLADQAAGGSFTAATQVSQTLTVNKKSITAITSPSVSNKVYDGTNAATISGTFVGAVNSDVLTLVGTYNNASVGTSKTVNASSTLAGSAASNYTYTGTQPTGLTANITAVALTVTGATTANKVYDGTTMAAVTGGSLVGVISPDVVTLTQVGTYSDKNVGTSKAITASCSIGGAGAGNYTLTQPTLTARDITVKGLTVTGATTIDKSYDGTITASVSGGSLVGVISPDVVTLTETGTYNDKNVGTSKAITASCSIGGADVANYYLLSQPTVTARNITPVALSIGSASIASKVYNGSSTSGTVTPGTLSGFVGSETVTVSSATGTYSDANVGIGKTATIVYTLADGTNSGKASNYSVVNGSATGDITPASVNNTGGNISTAGFSAQDLANTNITVTSGELVIDQNSTIFGIAVNSGAKLTLNSGSTLSTGTLTFQNDGTSHGTFVDANTNGGLTVSGSSTVNQFLGAARNWYISSPISNATAESGYTYYKYHETGDNTNLTPLYTTAYWENIGATPSLAAATGYIANLASGTATYSLSGTLNSGNIPLTLSRSGAVLPGFNLVGNPYPSFLDISSLVSNSDLVPTYWVRSKSGSYVFDTYNIPGGMSTGLSGFAVTSKIAPMQAFWLRVKSGSSSASVTFTNAMRAHQDDANNKFRAPSANALTQQVLRLQVTNGIATDETVMYTNSSASNDFDVYDSQKMSNSSASIPEIYTLADGEHLTINGLNSISYDTELPIGFSTGQSNTFSIKASQLANFDSGTQLILKDYLDPNNPVITDLSDGSAYTFSSGITNNNTTRFAVIFKAPSVATVINPESNGNVWFSTVNGQIVVNGVINGAILEVFNAVGQKVVSGNLTTTAYHTRNLPAGAYMVKVMQEGKYITKKIIVD